MVDSVTSLTNNGLRDWLVQRVTALIIGAYTIFIFVYLATHTPLTYDSWKALFNCAFMRIASIITLGALVFHAWVGIWTVTTDYIKPTWLRVSVQMLVNLCLIASFLWGVDIFWRA